MMLALLAMHHLGVKMSAPNVVQIIFRAFAGGWTRRNTPPWWIEDGKNEDNNTQVGLENIDGP